MEESVVKLVYGRERIGGKKKKQGLLECHAKCLVGPKPRIIKLSLIGRAPNRSG